MSGGFTNTLQGCRGPWMTKNTNAHKTSRHAGDCSRVQIAGRGSLAPCSVENLICLYSLLQEVQTQELQEGPT